MPLYFLSSSSALNKNEDFFFQVLLETKLSSNPSAKIWSQALYPTNQKRLQFLSELDFKNINYVWTVPHEKKSKLKLSLWLFFSVLVTVLSIFFPSLNTKVKILQKQIVWKVECSLNPSLPKFRRLNGEYFPKPSPSSQLLFIYFYINRVYWALCIDICLFNLVSNLEYHPI